jgi:hypothetical protein
VAVALRVSSEPMPSPEITRLNQISWRVGIADRRWREAVELLREAAATPSYTGPDLEVVERLGAIIAEVRVQVGAWGLDALD